jgi:hypothetical protein
MHDDNNDVDNDNDIEYDDDDHDDDNVWNMRTRETALVAHLCVNTELSQQLVQKLTLQWREYWRACVKNVINAAMINEQNDKSYKTKGKQRWQSDKQKEKQP